VSRRRSPNIPTGRASGSKRSYRRLPAKPPIWFEFVCTEDNRQVLIGTENYVLSADGHLTPTRKGQAAPDLRHFNQAGK
jgi:hypothetical protein